MFLMNTCARQCLLICIKGNFNALHINRNGEEESIQNIIYIFQYPNLPSFGSATWSSNYLTIDLSSVAGSLSRLGANIPKNFVEKPCRCIVRRLVVTFNTFSEIYYAHMSHWVQVKDEDDNWIDSF